MRPGFENCLFDEATPSTHRYPVALRRATVTSCGHGELVDWMRRQGIGRGSLAIWTANYEPFAPSVVFYPPKWRGPDWTEALDRQWRAIERTEAYSLKRRARARERIARWSPPRGHPPRSTSIGYGRPDRRA